MKIILDPGHGGNLASDRGFYGGGYEQNEGVNNFLTCSLIKAFLESRYKVEVLMTRQKVTDYPTITERGKMAQGYDFLYSRHSNASDKSVRGTEIWYNPKVNKKWADEASKVIADFFGHNWRNKYTKNGADIDGTAKVEGFLIINHAIKNGVPNAVMAEVGFHSNTKDAEILVEKRVELAELEAELIAKHLKLEVKPVEKKELDTAEKWAVDNGIMQDMKWDEPATRSQMAWWLFMMNRKFIEPLKK